MKPGTNGKGRKQKLETMSLDTISPPGMKPIKQVEMYKKWRKFVPKKYREEVCPRLTDKVLGIVSKMKKDKRDAKKKVNRRRRSMGVVQHTCNGVVGWATILL